MDLEFSEDEAALADAARDVLDGIAPTSVVRAVYEGTGDDAEVWRQMVELDWPGLAIAEEHGGVGMGFLELAIVVQQLGRTLAPGPFLATATQFAPAVQELGSGELQHRTLEQVASGSLTGSLALAERGSWRSTAVRARASRDEGGWRLSGTKEAVLHGATVDELVVIARGDDGLGAFLVRPADVGVTPRTMLDPTLPLADIALDGCAVPDERVLAVPGPDAEAALVRAVEQATVALALATTATCRRIFDDTLQYAKEREQYGRPIGSFQALKHRLADMYLAVERAASVCWYAALTIAEDDPRRAEAASIAKAAAGECQHLLVGEGLQLHGGIGMMWEHDLHFFLKRAKAGDALFGGAAEHRARLAERLGLVAQEVPA
ncbi:MAG TPA: acyl-CoA dehydrogenase family protein [Acidimicrobiales bacterium]|nr:acyl-CoA dehydrogenase family protein [Acidimicrobiales bacterium]